jgi:hypothetical protein
VGQDPRVIPIVAALDFASVARHGDRTARQYIGASSIGADCLAYLALSLRGFPNNDVAPRSLRIFQMGHLLETEVVADLKAAGFDVVETDPDTGEQWEFTAMNGHLVCHLDGVFKYDTERMVLEVKTMNKARFSAFVRKGVKVSDPKYYDQCQLAMWLSGMSSALFVSICKDDSKYHVEFVEYDSKAATALVDKARDAMEMFVKRITPYRDSFGCSMCFKSDACWDGRKEAEPDSCAKCAHSVPSTSSVVKINSKPWFCQRHGTLNPTLCPDFTWWRPK